MVTTDQMAQVVTMLTDLRGELLEGLAALEKKVDDKFDRLPDTYVTVREHGALVQQVTRFEEWRTSTIERQYQALLGISQRTDDAIVREAREDVSQARHQVREVRQDAQAQATGASATRSRFVGWGLTVFIAFGGWGLTLLLFILNAILQHVTWH